MDEIKYESPFDWVLSKRSWGAELRANHKGFYMIISSLKDTQFWYYEIHRRRQQIAHGRTEHLDTAIELCSKRCLSLVESIKSVNQQRSMDF